MDTLQLAKIYQAIANKDLYAMVCDQLVNWLAEVIREHAQFEHVVLRVARIEDNMSRPEPDARLYGAAAEPVDDEEAPKLRDWEIFGKAPVLGDVRPVTYDCFTGPIEDPLVPVTAGRRCLMVRVRSERFVSWVFLVDKEMLESEAEISQWAAILPPLLGLTLPRLTKLDPNTVRGCRQAFYEKLLRYDPRGKGLGDDFKFFCAAWQEVSNADWVWLWLYNSTFDELELTAFASKHADDEEQRSSVLPAERTAPGKTSIAAYCAKAERALYVSNVPDWRRELNGIEHRVEARDLLHRLGCKAFDCVPLFTSERPEDSDRLSIVGVVTLHYRDPHQRVPHVPGARLGMGGVTALMIRKSQAAAQMEILVKLNKMAQRYLSHASGRPTQLRAEYLGRLIELIKGCLNVRGVSVFWRMRFDRAVQCLASTGLEDRDGKPIPGEDLPGVVYHPDKGLTGKCFAEGRIRFSSHRKRATGHEGVFPEVRHVDPGDGLDPIVLIPIPRTSVGTKADQEAFGVIRCVEHISPVFQDSLCNFDAMDIETLGFIAEQVGPVLQTFEQRIEREQTISVVKHDLFAPLAMIRDRASKVLRRVQCRGEVKEYDLLDTVACSQLAMNLVDQLDLAPAGAAQELTLERTVLEGDIVARLKNMLSHYAWVQNRMKVHFDRLHEIPPLQIDRAQIERAMYNLLLNAIKYGRNGSTIELEARRTDTHFVLDVANFGIGVEPDETPYLFNPYYRSPRAAARTVQGVGLGLTIAKTAMEAHGGGLRLTSPKDPTVFSLLFPRTLIAGKEEYQNGR